MTELIPEITAWKIPNDITDGILVIQITIKPFRDPVSFYRMKDTSSSHRYEQMWAWKRMSLANKPSAPVWDEEAPILDALVREHPVLSRLLDQFGLDDG